MIYNFYNYRTPYRKVRKAISNLQKPRSLVNASIKIREQVSRRKHLEQSIKPGLMQCTTAVHSSLLGQCRSQ